MTAGLGIGFYLKASCERSVSTYFAAWIDPMLRSSLSLNFDTVPGLHSYINLSCICKLFYAGTTAILLPKKDVSSRP